MANEKNENEERFGNRMMLTGVVGNKRLTKTNTGKSVLNVYLRTKTSRGSYFGIGCEFWNKDAIAVNDQLNQMLPEVEDGERIAENDSVIVTVQGELKENSWESKGEKKSRFLIAGESLSIEE